MLKQFKPKSKYKRGSVALDIEEGMIEANERARKAQKNKRVAKFNARYV